jgi:N-acetylglutamate synthase-like GNAT family acetyltransferase
MPSAVKVRRASRQDLEFIAEIVHKGSGGTAASDPSALVERLLEWAYFVSATSRVMGVVRWQAVNFVACLKDLYVYPPVQRRRVGTPLLQRVEEEAKTLSCEVALLLTGRRSSWRAIKFYRELGYERAKDEDLAGAWREVLGEHKDADEIVLLKRLRATGIMAPIQG